MASFTTFLLVYLFGGLTFLPLLAAVAIYAWTRPVLTEPHPGSTADLAADRSKQYDGDERPDDSAYDGRVLPGDDVKTLDRIRREHAQERGGNGPSSGGGSRGAKKHHHHDRTDDFATAGYFAVHRTYVAMGVNSKPIEPGSSVGPAQVAPPSPSVYQTFFRSMLNKKPGADKVEVSNAASPRPKNAGHMFYVVLRHGHLILFDDDQQIDVRHVIKLADHDIGIYSGSDVTPEGELFIKRNALHLAPKNRTPTKAHNVPTPQPWFFYCENCSEKEDFYFALLRSQDQAPHPQDIDVRHLTALMERLHASEEAAEMRWFNALVGRLFLGVNKTSDVLKFVESKVITKLSRTPRPNFISSLVVQRVDIGDTTPQFTSPRLKRLTAEGECIIEADVRYSGHVEIDLAATLRVSTPIGQQEVKTSLAVVFTQLEGHVLFKIKAPPSNRIWFSFRHMPKIEMETRPIIMTRQLTWPVFIQMIEGRIKEAIAESIVLPFWDDTPFFHTEKKKWRGGLWEDDVDRRHQGTAIITAAANDIGESTGSDVGTMATSSTGVDATAPGVDENASPAVLRLRRLSRTHSSPLSADDSGRTGPGQRKQATDGSEMNTGMSPPKIFSRTATALTSPSEPVTGTDRFHAEASIPPTSPPKNGKHTSAAMSWLSSGTLRRKPSVSSAESDTPGAAAAASNRDDTEVDTSTRHENAEDADPIMSASDLETTEPPSRPKGRRTGFIESRSVASRASRASTSSLSSMAGPGTHPPTSGNKHMEPSYTASITSEGGGTPPAKRSAVLAAAMTGAAQSARRWGINALQRRATAAADRKARPGTDHRTSSGEPLDLSRPIGGGHPLPPPGEPLPMPSELALADEGMAAATKPLAKPTPVARRSTNDLTLRGHHEQKIKRKKIPSPVVEPGQLYRHDVPLQQEQEHTSSNESLNRRRQNTAGSGQTPMPPAFEQQDMLVVEAPIDSESDDSDAESKDGPASHKDPGTHPSNAAVEHAGDAASDMSHSFEEHDDAEHSDIPEEGRPDDLHGLPEGGVSSSSRSTDDGGHESPAAEDVEEDADDVQWGRLAESVVSAFLEDERNKHVAAHGDVHIDDEMQADGVDEAEAHDAGPSTA